MLKKIIIKYIERNREIVLKLAFVTIIGVACGILMYFLIGVETKNELKESMVKTLELSKDKEYANINVIYNGIKNNVVFITVLVISSFIVYGYLVIYTCYLIKGISLGMYSCCLFNIFGMGYGFLEVLMLVILVNAICLPALFGIGEVFINKNKNLFYGNIKKTYASKEKYLDLLKVMLYLIVIFSSIILEQIFAGITLNIYGNI